MKKNKETKLTKNILNELKEDCEWSRIGFVILIIIAGVIGKIGSTTLFLTMIIGLFTITIIHSIIEGIITTKQNNKQK